MDLGRILIESYGCTMNHGEARATAEKLSSLGYDVITGNDPDNADTIVLFTCDVITTTENRMWKRMDEASSSGRILMVAGCLASIAPDEILRRFPSAVVLNTMGLDDLEESLRSILGEKIEKVPSLGFTPPDQRVDTIVPISSGCMGNCSYCITKIARGKVSSYREEEILKMVSAGLSKGRNEILLTSQDLAAYGMDDAKMDLGSLLRSITGNMPGRYRVRVGMMNPALAVGSMESILDGYDHPNIFKFFHIPVQSGSDMILGSMNRGYSVDGFRKMLSSIRTRFPKASISTDLIIGFPGETDEDHRSSIAILEEISPEILNITRFSPRPGTKAYSMEDQVKGWIMKERSRQVTRLHSGIIAERMKERLGHHRECLVTEVGKEGTMMARDENNIPIIIEAEKNILGSFVDVDTSKVGKTYLLGGTDWKVC